MKTLFSAVGSILSVFCLNDGHISLKDSLASSFLLESILPLEKVNDICLLEFYYITDLVGLSSCLLIATSYGPYFHGLFWFMISVLGLILM